MDIDAIRTDSAKATYGLSPVRVGLAVAALAFIALVFLGISSKPDVEEAAIEQTASAQAIDVEQIKLAGMAYVTDQLRDPDSARFRNVEYREPFLCGEVNGKNGFGGYSGFERFITASKEATFIESSLGPGEMDAAWQKYCSAN